MQLIALKQHLQKVKTSSLLELCRALKIHPDLLRDMLQHWIRKGKVCQKTRENACGKTCVQCDPMFVEVYCWVTLTS